MISLVECIPNFSCSLEQSPEIFEGLKKVAEEAKGCTLLDIQSDGSHNRCVFTFVGAPEAALECAFALAEKASQTIDLRRHTGQHPRMGATDVIPFVPAAGVSMEECIELAKRLGKKMWEELGIPVFLYEEAASNPERKRLEKIRKGQFEGMAKKILKEEWAPDFGERKIHESAGVTAVGARMPLVAFNVNLDTPDVEIANKIARAIRGSSGGFQYCKAMGVYLEDRKLAQVSMNMVNYEGTPLHFPFEMIRALADGYGARVIGSEVVGLVPAKALLDAAAYYLKIEKFDVHNQVMEYHLLPE